MISDHFFWKSPKSNIYKGDFIPKIKPFDQITDSPTAFALVLAEAEGSSRVHRRLRPAPQAPFQWAFEKRKGLAKGERGFRKGGRAVNMPLYNGKISDFPKN